MASCIWYVSGFERPWEAAAIGNLAAALKAKGVPLQVYVEGGTGNLRVDGVLSWNSLTFFERLAAVLFRGRFWHLWGKAPFWWRWVRLRARTVHTSIDALPEWKGHPTRLFVEQVREGESLLKPTFEVRVAWAGDFSDTESEDSSSTLLLAFSPTDSLCEALERFEISTVSLAGRKSVSASELRKGRIAVVDDEPTNALLAAWLTMQGLPVIALKSSLIRSLLGKDGYIAVSEDTGDAWFDALEAARSEAGRTAAAGARRFLKENFTASASAESLIDLYRSVTKGRS